MELHLVADTNLFFECKALEELPWAELGHDPIVVLLTKPVLDEIDRHKKGTGRTKQRALDIFSRVRGMLATQEVEIQASSPKVVLRLAMNVRPDPALNGDLDYAKTDERLVGIVSTLNANAAGISVKLFSEDTGPSATADGLGVPYLMIDETWRRPPAESTEAKTIRDLQIDLATYRSQEPKIVIGQCDGAGKDNTVEVVRKIASPLTNDEIERVLAALRLRHPLVTDFTPPQPLKTIEPSGEVVEVEYSTPADEDIANYRDVLYLQWIEHSRNFLADLHKDRDEAEPALMVRLPVSNNGTRPATNVRIEFDAKGSIELRRAAPENDDEADDDDDVSQPEDSAPPAPPRFASPPSPPAFRQQVTRTPAPPKLQPKLTRSVDISTMRAKDLMRKSIDDAERFSKLLGVGRYDHLLGRDHLKGLTAMTEATRLMGQSSLFGRPGIGDILSRHTVEPVSLVPTPPMDLSRALRPFVQDQRDPESFYYIEWRSYEPVTTGVLTCELWRHQTGERDFEFEVLFIKDGEVRASVECTVHADNLTTPVRARVIVARKIEELNLMDLATSMVDACN